MPFRRDIAPSGRKLLAIAGFAVAVTLMVLANQQVIRGDRLDRDTRELSDSLLRLQAAAGYGGFIHDFKNYILRPKDVEYRIGAADSLERMKSELDNLEAIASRTGTPHDLSAVRKVVAEYSDALLRVDELVAQKYSAREIDARVRVDDTDAVGKVAELAASIRERQAKTYRRIKQWSAFVGNTLLLLAVATYASLSMQVVNLRLRSKSGRASDLRSGSVDPARMTGE